MNVKLDSFLKSEHEGKREPLSSIEMLKQYVSIEICEDVFKSEREIKTRVESHDIQRNDDLNVGLGMSIVQVSYAVPVDTLYGLLDRLFLLEC